MKPKIGVPRLYEGAIGVLYPGERAHAIVAVSEEDLLSAAAGNGIVVAKADMWLVEPEPGWLAWYRRWRYRLVGQFVNRLTRGRPKLDIDVFVSRGADHGDGRTL